MVSNHVGDVVFPSLYFWHCTDVRSRHVVVLPDRVCTVSLSPPLTLHESSKGLKRGDSGPKLATPRIFPHVLAASSCFWRTSWFPLKEKRHLSEAALVTLSSSGPGGGGENHFSYPPPGRLLPAFLVFVGTTLSLVIDAGASPAVSVEHAGYIRRITDRDAAAHTAQRSGAVTACVDGWARRLNTCTGATTSRSVIVHPSSSVSRKLLPMVARLGGCASDWTKLSG